MIAFYHAFLYNVGAAHEQPTTTGEVINMAVTADKVSGDEAEAKERDTIALVVPSELKDLIEAKAKAENTTVAGLVRGQLAELYDYTISGDFGTRSKYGSDEERKAAQKQKNAKRNELMKMLMKKFRAGEIDLDSLIMDDDDEDEVDV